jgi:hypothetical protein
MWSSPDVLAHIDYLDMVAYVESLRITDEFLSELEMTLRQIPPSKVQIFKEEFSGIVEYRINVDLTPKTVAR